MKIINFGSLNIDNVYLVDNFVRPGETLTCCSYKRFSGGKGLNQSISLSLGGTEVIHVGKIGVDGMMLIETLVLNKVNTDFIKVVETPSGHANIEVDKKGENRIILHSGANGEITKEDINDVLFLVNKGDYVLCQNETNMIGKIIRVCKDRGARIVFNPAPMTLAVKDYPLVDVDYLILNEIEGEGITGERLPDKILDICGKLYPRTAVVLTLGNKGAVYSDTNKRLWAPSIKTNVIDTTAAGDTFIGYFISEIIKGKSVENALRMGCVAAGICVSRKGASNSIPPLSEVVELLAKLEKDRITGLYD